ncbi:N-acetyltransferase [Prolixibacteraceae bacterium JC049]|nr:N-acetyltransferase [Prolixibacteraceae bacterium JC049]
MNTSNITIRQETENDHKAVFTLIEKAFESLEISDHKEQFLVERLRKSDAFVPELALVAELDQQIVGYILLTKVVIKNEKQSVVSLCLAPVAVLPEYQNGGVGEKLIRAAHIKAAELGFKSIVLLGHEAYYPRFGYQQLHQYNIQLPFDAPKENCMVIELTEDALYGISGKIEFPGAFFE